MNFLRSPTLKKIIFILTLLHGCFFMAAAQNIAVANDNENIFYRGMDNHVSLAVESMPCNSIIVKTDNGTIEGKNCSYIFRSNQLGIANIIIYKKANGKLKEIGRRPFRVKSIPLPQFRIGSGRPVITAAEIAAQEYVRAEMVNFDIDLRYLIEHFTVEVVPADTSVKTTPFKKDNIGNKINDEIREQFKLLKPNDTVIFSDIVFTGLNGEHTDLDPVYVRIKP